MEQRSELVAPSAPRLTEQELLLLCRRTLQWAGRCARSIESRAQISDWQLQLEDLIAAKTDGPGNWPIFLADQIGRNEDAGIIFFGTKPAFSKDWLLAVRSVLRRFTFPADKGVSK